jgi:O-antigen ligase
MSGGQDVQIERMAPARRVSPQEERRLLIALAGAGLAASLGLAVLAGPGLALVGVLGLLGIVTLLIHPESALVLVPVVTLAIPAQVYASLAFHALGFTWYGNDWILAALLGGLVLRRLAGIRAPVVGGRPHLPTVVLVVSMVLFAFYGLHMGNGKQYVFSDLRPFVYYGIAILAPHLLTNRMRLLTFAWAAIVCGLIGSLWGIARALAGPSFEIYGLSLHFARLKEGVFPLTLLAALGLLIGERSTLGRWVLVATLLSSAVGSFLTYSRGTYLGLGAGLVVLVVLLATSAPRKAVRLLFVAAAVVAATALIMQWAGIPFEQSFVERTQSISLRNVDVSIGSRLLEWTTVFAAWYAHPVLGAGLGHLYVFYIPLTKEWSRQIFCHNSFLYVLSKTGVVGLSVFLFFLLAWGTAILVAYRRAVDDVVRGVVLGWAAGYIFLLVKSTTTWYLNESVLPLYLGLAIGATRLLALAPRRFAEPARDVTSVR